MNEVMRIILAEKCPECGEIEAVWANSVMDRLRAQAAAEN